MSPMSVASAARRTCAPSIRSGSDFVMPAETAKVRRGRPVGRFEDPAERASARVADAACDDLHGKVGGGEEPGRDPQPDALDEVHRTLTEDRARIVRRRPFGSFGRVTPSSRPSRKAAGFSRTARTARASFGSCNALSIGRSVIVAQQLATQENDETLLHQKFRHRLRAKARRRHSRPSWLRRRRAARCSTGNSRSWEPGTARRGPRLPRSWPRSDRRPGACRARHRLP